MAHKAVFVDRDRTLMEDPGYISDPQGVKLLPGVELAIRSLHQAGYKVVVVTNQSGVARGLLAEEMLEEIHAELRRQLGEKGVHLDAIYYCPYHPEGTVEQYAIESELRKPKPGMLLKAAAEMDIDLAASWMVGDSARDVEAGQRAGCKTVRVRLRPLKAHAPEDQDESVLADFTVRNLVDAARIILRENSPQPAQPAAEVAKAGLEASPPPRDLAGEPAGSEPIDTMDDRKVRQEILRHVRRLAVERYAEEFSFTKLLAGVVQMLALLALLMTFWRMLQGDEQLPAATLWGIITVALQMMALTFFIMQRSR